MSNESIHFSSAQVVGIENKIQHGHCLSRIKIAALFDATVAKKMNAQWIVFDNKRDIREGFNELGLAYEMRDFTFRFEVPKMPDQVLEIGSELAGKFKVMRSGDGKKKPKKLLIKFVVEHHHNPFSLLEWLLKVGGAQGALTLTTKQASLPLAEGKPESERREVVADKRFPQPNQHGVYRLSDAMSERINVDQKRFARVYVLQIGNDEFINAVQWQFGTGGHSEPLSRSVRPRAFVSRDAAFRAALSRVAEGVESFMAIAVPEADRKAARKIADWAANLAATKYSGVAAAAAGGAQ